MSALLSLQRSFQAYVLGERPVLPATVAGTGAASAEERMHVYSNAIRIRFLEVLGEDYPGVLGLAGDDEFRNLGLAYADAHASTHPSIRWFGRHLPSFLTSTAPWRNYPVLGEMARFEWAKNELLDAPDSPVATIEDIAAIPAERWGEMRPRLKPAVRRLSLEWNVSNLWKALDRGDAPPAPTRSEQPVAWLLWRQDLHIRWRSLEPDEAWALRRGADGETFGSICAGLCERTGEDVAAFRAATYLKQWAADTVLEAV